METTLYRVNFEDGREFRVFCANKNQKRRMEMSFWGLESVCTKQELVNGIHTIEQWEKIAKEDVADVGERELAERDLAEELN